MEEGPEEVRLALALNGGVSLAIWIGGVAVELDGARRGHLGPEDLGDGRERTVYAGICAALNRRVVVDLMAGSSAGGINAGLLAAAASRDRRLHPDFVREEWIRLGDLGYLLQPTGKADPPSLLQGERFHEDIAKTFGAVLSTERRNELPRSQRDRRWHALDTTGAPDPAEPDDRSPTIEITATDLAGDQVDVVDTTDTTLSAREFRARFRFTKDVHYTVENLASAARSSASFPVAFEPWWVAKPALDRANLKAPRWMMDGGLLNNAPIATVLGLIPTRVASGSVKRILCYVNPDPHSEGDGGFSLPPGSAPAHTPEVVLGRSLTILRGADFVDHVRALQRAVQPPRMFHFREERLLRERLESLEETAVALVPAYNLTRGRASVEELTGVPPTPSELLALGPLPWLAATVYGLPYADDATGDAGGAEGGRSGDVNWRLGVRGAQRALHLCADALRRGNESGLAVPDGADAAATDLDRLIATLEAGYTAITAGGALARAVLDPRTDPSSVYEPIDVMTEDLMLEGARVLWDVLAESESPLRALFFGDAGGRPERAGDSYRMFIRRLQAIEVVRRASQAGGPAIETAAAIGFLQVTPFTPSPIFGAGGYASGPDTVEEKLCGIRWGHFAAFYKRSWRVNDYMWGRLDGAARIVEALFDGADPLSEPRRRRLADSLLAGGDADTASMLRDSIRGPRPALSQLRERLAEALLDPDAACTICIRAVQLEILRDEIEQLTDASERDHLEGSGTAPLQLPGRTLTERVDALRAIPDLPAALGRDNPEEMTSDLALRTGSNAIFVAIAAIAAMKKPFGELLGLIRPALYALAGTVSSKLHYRLVALLGFLAAGSYLASRAVQVDPGSVVPADSVGAGSTVLALISILVVAGVLFAPAVRLRFGVGVALNAMLAVVILLAAGITAIIPQPSGVDWLTGGLPILNWFVAPDVETIPVAAEWLISLVVIGVAVGTAFGGRLLAPLKNWLASISARPWAGWWTLAALIGASGLSLCFSLPDLIEFGYAGEWDWRETLATLVFAGSGSIGLLLVATLTAVPEPAEPPVVIWEIEFDSVSYYGPTDALAIKRGDFRAGDRAWTCENPLDKVYWSPEHGISAIVIFKARERAEQGGHFLRLPAEVKGGEPLPAARILALINSQGSSAAQQVSKQPLGG